MHLSVNDLYGGYGSREILHGISFSAESGDVVCILGPNGCGKSTLLKFLLNFMPRKSGRIEIDGTDISCMPRKALARTVAYIPQSDSMAFPYTLLEMVLMGRSCHMSRLGTPGEQDLVVAHEALESLHIAHLAQKHYTAVSGGERQLAMIARAMCQDSQVLIMDEPTASLDYANQELIMEAVRTASLAGRIVIMTTHSPAQPFYIASKVLLIAGGEAQGFGPPLTVLTADALEQVYGIPMDIVEVKDRNGVRRCVCFPVHAQK